MFEFLDPSFLVLFFPLYTNDFFDNVISTIAIFPDSTTFYSKFNQACDMRY